MRTARQGEPRVIAHTSTKRYNIMLMTHNRDDDLVQWGSPCILTLRVSSSHSAPSAKLPVPSGSPSASPADACPHVAAAAASSVLAMVCLYASPVCLYASHCGLVLLSPSFLSAHESVVPGVCGVCLVAWPANRPCGLWCPVCGLGPAQLNCECGSAHEPVWLRGIARR